MKHAISISVSKHPADTWIASVRQLSIRELMLSLLLGKKARVTVIVPGDSVEELAIKKLKEGDVHEVA